MLPPPPPHTDPEAGNVGMNPEKAQCRPVEAAPIKPSGGGYELGTPLFVLPRLPRNYSGNLTTLAPVPLTVPFPALSQVGRVARSGRADRHA